jgi:multidrug resistance protein MdtO
VVRAVLWVWVIVVYPIALTVVINQILLPAHPHTALIRALVRRLDAATTALERIVESGGAGGKESAALLDLATRGSAPLLKLLGLAESKDAWLKERHASHVTAIAASEQIATAAAALGLREREPIAEGDQRCAKALIEEIASLRAAVQSRHTIPTPVAAPCAAATLLELRELQLATASLRESLAGGRALPATSPAKVRKHLVVADAFSNPAHARFALKVTLAAMMCYLIYTSLNWPGIRTALITCCFVALESTGASLRKAWLRLSGCIIGGMLGFLSLVYLVPHMETIVSLALLTAAVTALAGWVAAGSERIAYAGLQIGFAFYLSIFQGFAPATDFDVIRDRLAGIILGIVVLSLVFHYLWPERAVDRLRETLARALRNLARLLAIPRFSTSPESSAEEGASLPTEISGNLDDSLRLAELGLFEDNEADLHASLRAREIEAMVHRTQGLHLTATILTGRAALVDWQGLSEAAQACDSELRNAAVAQLERIAARIENDAVPKPVDPNAPLSACDPHHIDSLAEAPDRGRADLLRGLTVQVQDLV